MCKQCKSGVSPPFWTALIHSLYYKHTLQKSLLAVTEPSSVAIASFNTFFASASLPNRSIKVYITISSSIIIVIHDRENLQLIDVLSSCRPVSDEYSYLGQQEVPPSSVLLSLWYGFSVCPPAHLVLLSLHLQNTTLTSYDTQEPCWQMIQM